MRQLRWTLAITVCLGVAFGQAPTILPVGQYEVGVLVAYQAETGKAEVRTPSGQTIRVDALVGPGEPAYRLGQRVIVLRTEVHNFLEGPLRTEGLALLLAVFAAVALILGRGKGLRALIGTGASLAVILGFVLPRIVGGANPLLTTIGGAFGILCLTIYFVHGVSRKTTAALLGTTVACAASLGLVFLAGRGLHLTGFNGDELSLSLLVSGVDPLGLYLAAVVLGALGALNDVTVTQAAVVEALARVRPLGVGALYRRAMSVGFDHIGSLVNTLVLAYAAGSLPLLVLLVRIPDPWWVLLSNHEFAAQVASLLIGTTSLLLAVPLTTLVAALLLRSDGGRWVNVRWPHEAASAPKADPPALGKD